MNMSKAWSIELIRIVLLILAALFLSGLFSSFLTSLIFIFSLYLIWHLYNFLKLFEWLANYKEHPPKSAGIWGEIFNQLYKVQQRSTADNKRLKRQLARFEESATALPDGTVILNKKDIIEWFNEAAERLLGLRRQRDYNQRIDNLVRHPIFTEYLNGNDYESIIEMPSPVNQNIILRIQLVPYRNKQKLLLARNVTRLHNLELIRRDFIANVSHELRTPLTVITGFLENFETSVNDKSQSTPPNWDRPIQLMQEQSSRMLSIIDDLLFISRLETDTTSGKKELVDVSSLLGCLKEDAINYSGIYNHHVELEADESLQLKGDQNELFSAFSNLIINAIKYTGQGGKIKIRWFASATNAAVFEVKDSGIGIASQHLPRLTERFYRVDVGRSRQQGGTGLGLAIVKHVLIRHNAMLEVDSEIDKGTTFRCVFPESLSVRT